MFHSFNPTLRIRRYPPYSQAFRCHNESRYTGAEATRKLGFKNRLTLWRWRRRGLIGFYRIGNWIYYGDSHISQFLARCERKARGMKEAA
jgi:hypothetical protein